MLIHEILGGVRSLLFPSSCLGCRSPLEEDRSPLCPLCLKQLPFCRPPWCRRCGRSLAHLGAGVDSCEGCRKKRPFLFDRAVSALLYEGAVQEMIVAFKYRAELSLAPFLAGEMARAARERLGEEPPHLILPVPLHPVRARERGFNQAQVLGEALASRLDCPFRDGLLRRLRPTRPQAELEKEERLANVRGAFGVTEPPGVAGRRILLADDVLTTGATANACAAALLEAGAAGVTVVTAAQG